MGGNPRETLYHLQDSQLSRKLANLSVFGYCSGISEQQTEVQMEIAGKNNSLRLIFLLFFLSCSFFSAWGRDNPPAAEEGVIDLRRWDFEQDGMVLLDGEWEFFWQDFIKPSSADIREGGAYIKVPGSWMQDTIEADNLSPEGWGTYCLRILLPEELSCPGIHLPHIPGDFRLYINGKLAAESGNLKTQRGPAEDSFRASVIPFVQAPEVNVVIQISDFNNLSGGIISSIRLGTFEQATRNKAKKDYFDIFLFGTLMIIGFYHLSFFIIRKKDTSALYFGLFAILLGLRSLIYGQELLFTFLPWISVKLEMTIGHLTFYLAVPIFMSYLYSVFPEFRNRWVSIPVLIVSLLFSLLAIFTPHRFYVKLLFVYQIVTLLIAVYTLVVLIKGVRIRRREALAFIAGFLVIFILLINDILYAQLIISTAHLIPVGLLVFIFSQSVMLSWRFTKALNTSERLTAELSDTNRSMRRFIPEEFLRFLNRGSITEVALGDHVEKEMTIMFCDIRNFTFLSEHLSTEENFKFINSFLRRMGPIIREYGGFIDKYIGDAIMALFPSSADNALYAAIDMQTRLAEYNEEKRLKLGRITISMGIGIHTGKLMLGTIGEEERMDSTVISNAVNLTSRIEEMTKQYGLNIAISQSTFQNLADPGMYNIRFMGKVPVKGKKEPIAIFDLFDGDPPEMQEKKLHFHKDFEEAVNSFYLNRYKTSFKKFNSLLSRNPEDTAPIHYIRLIQSLHRAGIVDLL